MTEKELMQQALDALLYHTEQTRPITRTAAAITALRERLAADGVSRSSSYNNRMVREDRRMTNTEPVPVEPAMDRHMRQDVLDYIDSLQSALKVAERKVRIKELKNQGTLATNLCPDHKDKQQGQPCLACVIEKLKRQLQVAQQERDELRALNLCKGLAEKDRQGLLAVGMELIARGERAEKAEQMCDAFARAIDTLNGQLLQSDERNKRLVEIINKCKVALDKHEDGCKGWVGDAHVAAKEAINNELLREVRE